MIRRLGYVLVALCTFVTTALATPLAAAQTVMDPPRVPTGELYGSQSKQHFSNMAVHVKLQPGNGVHLMGSQFVGGDSAETARLNQVLGGPGRAQVKNLVAPIMAQTRDSQSVSPALTSAVSSAVQDYYTVSFSKPINVASVVAQLSALSDVVAAYPETLPAPAPAVPSYTSLENFLKSAPIGIDTLSAAKFGGSNGSAARLVDIEYSWNTAHADLLQARNARHNHGTPVDPFADNNHGTAVLGELISDSNSFGTTGIVPKVKLALINASSVEYGYDPVGALLSAAAITKPGDVVMLEQQAWGPTGTGNDFVPIEWIPEVYDTIRSLISHGVIVVEAAGNGGQSLDNAAVFGKPFPLGKPSSGALIVGAGESCTLGPSARSWLSFSNYGSRIDLQGPGDCVVTTGYGDLYSAAGTNYAYTNTFNGTSSATPVVAAAAAALSSAYQTLNAGAILAPATIRSILLVSGSSQPSGATASQSGASAQHIGPLPNLAKALLKTDKTPPATDSLQVHLNSSKAPVLQWHSAADNVQVAYYRVFRGGKLYKTVIGTSMTDLISIRNHTYTYQIAAVDEAGNRATLSAPVRIYVPR